jgi:hypothetical protein
MAGGTWVVRVLALVAAALFLAAALAVRAFTGDWQGGNDPAQYSGTALYASMVYAGVIFLWPRIAPLPAGVIATAFCWLVELAQLTGIPAELSARSLLARLVLGIQFDWTDMLWYPIGVWPLVAIDPWLRRSLLRRGRAAGHADPA